MVQRETIQLGLLDTTQILSQINLNSPIKVGCLFTAILELRGCVKVEVAVLGSPSLIVFWTLWT